MFAGIVVALSLFLLIAWSNSGRLFPGEALRIEGADLIPVGATARPADGSLQISSIVVNSNRPVYLREEGSAFLRSGPLYLEVAPYRFVHCDCERRSPMTRMSLVWQQAGTGEPSGLIEMPFVPGGAFVDPAGEATWAEAVFEIGLLVEGPTDEPVTVHAIELYPDSAWSRLRWQGSQWLSFRPWSHTSINSVDMGAGERGMPLAVFAVTSCLLAIAVFLLLSVNGSRRNRVAGPVVIVLLFWLVLDLRWTGVQLIQARVTTERHASLDVAGRVDLQDYAPIVRFADQVKAAMEDERSVLFIVTGNPGNRFLMERLAFELLPANPFNLKNRFWLLRRHSGDGNYVVLLEPPDHLAFDADRSMLQWPGRGRVCAQLVLEVEFAQLYRICSPQP